MEVQTDLAITLRSVPYQERHRIITGLTENHGRISVIARNSIQSRRFGGSLEPFSAAEWRFVLKSGSELGRVDEATIRRGFEGIRSDFGKLALASVFNELMLHVAPEREPCQELFKLHANALAWVEEMPPQFAVGRGPVLNAYVAKLLQWSGNQPQLLECQGCAAKLTEMEPDGRLSVVVEDASWVCPACRDAGSIQVKGSGTDFQSRALRLRALVMRDLLEFLSVPIRAANESARATSQDHEELFGFLEGLLIFHMPGFDRGSLKSLRFLNP